MVWEAVRQKNFPGVTGNGVHTNIICKLHTYNLNSELFVNCREIVWLADKCSGSESVTHYISGRGVLRTIASKCIRNRLNLKLGLRPFSQHTLHISGNPEVRWNSPEGGNT